MPRQQTISRGPKDRDAAPKPAQKRKNGRAINALSIAEKQIPNKLGVRRTRLGYYDDGSNPKRYSNRDDDEDGDEEGDVPDYKRRRFNTAPDNESLNGGSDSEGHEWKLGQVDSDDDSELDSDEALGESDEERFEGFTFRGSSTTKSKSKAKKPTKKRADVNSSEEGESDEDDDLGEDAVDLLTAWDMNTAEEEAEAKKAATKSKRPSMGEDSDEDSGSEGDSEEDESDDDQLSFTDEDADDQGDGLSKLQDFVDSMDTGRRTKSTQKSQEQGKPSEYGLTSSRKLTVADLLPSITDSRLKGSLKHVDAAPKESKAGIPGKLDAPLAKRQQDKLDRSAAYDKSKETLDRWIETVKHNRRAEHLVFPLPDPDNEQVHRMDSAKPANDLEATIQNILTESGLSQANGQSNEEEVQGFEEIQARTLPIEEIQARRAELRKRRDLLFREEVRSKRIKKIKSKAYRRVHRKERERLELQEKQALLEAGVDLDEMDQEKNERLRAEARMGSKHRDSKWAKSLKETGRTAWDEEARNGAADLALREEELRRRIEGKSVSRGDDTYLESSSESEGDEDPWASDASDVEKRKVQKKLRALDKEADTELPKGQHSNLFSMKFMQNAEAARKEENDAEVRRLNRELHGEGSESEAESDVGRRKFGQSKKTDAKPQTKALPKNELEETAGSDDEDQDVDIVVDRPVKQKPATSAPSKPTSKPSDKMFTQQPKETAVEENPWLVSTERTNRRRTGTDAHEAMEITLDDEEPETLQAQVSSKKTKPAKKSQQTSAKKASYSDAQNDSDDEDNVPVLLKNHDLVKRAFAGDEVVQDFEQEKLDTIEDEGDKVIDNTLDGWGSWAGEGVSKKSQKNKKRFLTKVEGVKPEQRKDAKLDRVIINQKRVKKNAKYMASTLPHEFESKAQYERSLRMPLGPEWSTKETYQSGTKPRVIVKKGIIKPMDKPMI
ncbi:hypothetical protein N7478_004250 [Penicillium angulare]|uniref:uncharacterized protein n=1 Tax=Penicillium angulare TaxID=116970 RepID=UPI0025417A39|nr:uncharacterized protein N7478_004250 [Penicillium angulare]KAJ5278878.1 hypothetical protein N7478_004250 [Penicillium angulare]